MMVTEALSLCSGSGLLCSAAERGMQRMSRTAHVPQLTTMGHISDTRERNSNANHCSVPRFLSPLVMFVIHVAVFSLWVCLHVSFRQFCVQYDPCEGRRPTKGFVNASRFHNRTSFTRRSAVAAWDDLPWRCAALAVSARQT